MKAESKPNQDTQQSSDDAGLSHDSAGDQRTTKKQTVWLEVFEFSHLRR